MIMLIDGPGNMAVGNLQYFLPVIVKMVETDSQRRLLSLHALKEVWPESMECRVFPQNRLEL